VPYVVMEFVDGIRIDRYSDDEQLDVTDRLRLLLEVCGAVQHAHQNLVIHRDLKPSNILVTTDGVPKLLDFGIGKLLDTEADSNGPADTRTEHRILTPEYAAPEQLRGEPVTTASDVFALGIVLYEVLTGTHPWAGVAQADRLSAIERGPPTAPSEAVAAGSESGPSIDPARRRRRLAGDLDTIVLKALRPEPERRYPTVDALADDLRRHLEGRPVSARPDTFGYRARRFVSRHRAAVLAGTVVTLTLVGAGAAIALQRAEAAERVAADRDKLRETQGFLLEMFGAVGPDESPGGEVSARALLDAQAKRLDDYADRPELQAEIQLVLADGYQRLGLLDQARPLADSALQTRVRVLAPDDPDVARARALLGWIERERGEIERAAELLREAVASLRVASPAAPEALAKALNDLGVVLGDQAHHEKAASALEEALALRRAAPGGDRRSVGVTANNLSSAYWQLGRRDEAVPLLEESLAALEASLGPEHGRVWLARANLLIVRTEGQPPEERVAAWREYLDRAERVFGPMHRETAWALYQLGSSLYQARPGPDGAAARLAESAATLTRAVEVADSTFGPTHPRTAIILVGQSNGFLLGRRYRESIAARERAIEIYRSAYGDDYPDIGLALREIARARYGLGEGEEGDRIAREALEHHRRAFGPRHSTTLSQQVNVARRMTATGQAPAAVPMLRDALDGIERLDPKSARLAIQTRIALALAMARADQREAADSVLEPLRPEIDTLPAPIVRAFRQAEEEIGKR